MINTGNEVLWWPTGREATMKIARVLVLLACAALSGCARLQVLGGAMDGGGVERAEGSFHIVRGHNQRLTGFGKAASIPGRGIGYFYMLDKPRFVRHIRLHTVDPVRNTDVYVRAGDEDWKLVNRRNKSIDAKTSIGINMRTDTILVVQNTDRIMRRDFIEDIDVYVQRK